MTRALRDIPAVRALAEREARAFYDALPPLSPQRTPRAVRRMSTTTEPGWETVGSETTTWEEQSEEWRNAIIAAYLALLTDLSRPASRDAVARLVAEAVGLECGATAPSFGRYVCGEHCCDGDIGRMTPCARSIWSMMGANETQMVVFADAVLT